jgi:hypothetical protein
MTLLVDLEGIISLFVPICFIWWILCSRLEICVSCIQDMMAPCRVCRNEHEHGPLVSGSRFHTTVIHRHFENSVLYIYIFHTFIHFLVHYHLCNVCFWYAHYLMQRKVAVWCQEKSIKDSFGRCRVKLARYAEPSRRRRNVMLLRGRGAKDILLRY